MVASDLTPPQSGLRLDAIGFKTGEGPDLPPRPHPPSFVRARDSAPTKFLEIQKRFMIEGGLGFQLVPGSLSSNPAYAYSQVCKFATPDRLGFLEVKTIVHCMRPKATVELDAGTKTFASGLLPDLIAALRRSRKGDLVAVNSGDPRIGPELEAWCRFTRNSLVDIGVEEGRTRWVFRYGKAPDIVGEDRPVGSRLWLYTQFRLQPELRLLLRALVTQSSATRSWSINF
jgi:hypothetical protein